MTAGKVTDGGAGYPHPSLRALYQQFRVVEGPGALEGADRVQKATRK